MTVMIWYAIALHWLWGALLLSSHTPLNVTAIAAVVKLGVVSAQAAGVYYCLIAVVAMLGLSVPRRMSIPFLLPQTMTLWLAAYSAVTAMLSGTFADGVIRGHTFLIADQAPAVLAAIGHTLAVVSICRERHAY